MTASPKGPQTDRTAMYREMQRAVPGLDAMYRLAHALIASHGGEAPHVLVVGAGGGREIAEFRSGATVGRITAIDPSARNLDTVRDFFGSSDASHDIRFYVGTVDDLPAGETFDIATSLLVMHHLPDDGAKLAYLRSVRDRLAPDGLLIHADVCFDEREEFNRLIPAYLAHADLVGASSDATHLEIDAIPRLPVASVTRTGSLFAQAGLTDPFEVFRTLWYRCWISTRRQP